MPVCILGMHRSGTSMVTYLLHQAGLDLGPKQDLLDPTSGTYGVTVEDNPAGYWESIKFLELNDEILSTLGGDYVNLPPILRHSFEDDKLAPLRQRARGLLMQFDGSEHWGWKDPRNTLTLGFWQQLIPDLRIVVCVRNPAEIVASVIGRNFDDRSDAVRWILSYYEVLAYWLEDVTHIVTHYDTYFYDAEAELKRLVEFLELSPGPKVIKGAAQSVSKELKRHVVSPRALDDEGIPHNLQQYYESLCAKAGPVYEKMLKDKSYQLHMLEEALHSIYGRQEVKPQSPKVEAATSEKSDPHLDKNNPPKDPKSDLAIQNEILRVEHRALKRVHELELRIAVYDVRHQNITIELDRLRADTQQKQERIQELEALNLTHQGEAQQASNELKTQSLRHELEISQRQVEYERQIEVAKADLDQLRTLHREYLDTLETRNEELEEKAQQLEKLTHKNEQFQERLSRMEAISEEYEQRQQVHIQDLDDLRRRAASTNQAQQEDFRRRLQALEQEHETMHFGLRRDHDFELEYLVEKLEMRQSEYDEAQETLRAARQQLALSKQRAAESENRMKQSQARLKQENAEIADAKHKLQSQIDGLEEQVGALQAQNSRLRDHHVDSIKMESQLELAQLTAQIAILRQQIGEDPILVLEQPQSGAIEFVSGPLRYLYHRLVPTKTRLKLRDRRRTLRGDSD